MEQLQVLSRARPVRIAFLVAMDEHAHAVLDAIFGCAFSLWGGRFAMVVPCANGTPFPNYLPWLKAFDPDLIYSYVDIADGQEARIHDEIYPSELTYHSIKDGSDVALLRPNLPFAPLGITTVLPWASLPRRFDEGRGVHVIHAIGSQGSDRFINDNFGANFGALNALRAQFSHYGEPLILITTEDKEKLRGHIREGELTVPTIPTLLTTLARDPRGRSQAELSAMAAPRFSPDDRRWGKSFNLIIGDTPDDRILYWNTRAFVPAWRDGEAVDLCVSPKNFGDKAFLDALGYFLSSKNTVNEGYGNAPPRVSLRSLSLTNEQLAPFMEDLKARVKWQVFECEQMPSLGSCVPTAEVLGRARLAAGGAFRREGLWKESYGAGSSLRLEPPQPAHLRALPRELITPEGGAWAVDLDIQRSLDHSPFENVQHRWRLPRRLRVTEAFCRDYQLIPPHGRQVAPRTSEGGFLTVFAIGDDPLPNITLPSDFDAIRIGLQRGRNWRPIHQHVDQGGPDQLCYMVERSDAGQHFYGVYQMFGSLQAARSILLHRFWRQQFDSLGATERRAEVRHGRVVRQIQRRLGGGHLDLSQAVQREILANLVLQEADAERMTTPNLKWTDLAKDFEEVVDQHIKDYVDRYPDPQQEEEERQYLRSSLRDCVRRCSEMGILNQGYELRCPKCLHRNWVALGDLKVKVHCQVCHHPNVAPVDQSWQFRMNGFLREALQRHGVGPLFWVLARYQKNARSASFWFEGPLNIYFDLKTYDQRQPAGDVDLTIVQDGSVTMCEAKRSSRGFNDPRATAALFSKLRPDIALIAVMEAPSQALQAKFDEFAGALAGTGIEPRLWTLDEAVDYEDAPWF